MHTTMVAFIETYGAERVSQICAHRLQKMFDNENLAGVVSSPYDAIVRDPKYEAVLTRGPLIDLTSAVSRISIDSLLLAVIVRFVVFPRSH